MTPRNATCGVVQCRRQSPLTTSHELECPSPHVSGLDSPLASLSPIPREGGRTMLTSLVDVQDATARLASGEQPYAFETSDGIMMVGPACGYGREYLSLLRTEGRYAESFEVATSIADARGATIIGIWFVKQRSTLTGT
jgi:hypothetical protein